MSDILLRLRKLGGWVAVLLALGGFLPSASGVTLEWDPSPDAWVAGYTVRYGSASGDYTVRLDVGNRTSATITNLTPGATYYFVATAYASDGQESLPSNEVLYTVLDHATPDSACPPLRVVAGADQQVLWPSPVALVGEVSDDGLPSTSKALSVQWSVVSGPGSVSFGSVTALSTSASFTTAGVYLIRLTATEGGLAAADDLIITVFPDSPAHPVGFVVEAEAGGLSYPMQRSWRLSADESHTVAVCISSCVAAQGVATYLLEVPEAGAYVVWARLLATNKTSGAFYLSCDDAAAGVLATDPTASPANTWHWVRLAANNGSARAKPSVPASAVPKARLFLLHAGLHLITVRGGEAGLLLDRFLVTNNRSFVPSEGVVEATAPVVSGLRSDTGGVRVTWSSTSGAVYRLVYKDTLAASRWLPASPNVVAVGNALSWLHQTTEAPSQRYYSILVVRE